MTGRIYLQWTYGWRRVFPLIALVVGLLLSVQVAFAESEPNDSMVSAVPISVGLNGISGAEINPAGDVDYYKFDAVAGRTYVVEVYNVSTSLGRTVLYAYDSSGTQVASDTYCYNGTGNVCSRVALSASITQTYFLKVRAYSSTAIGTYSVRVLARYGELGYGVDATSEPNDVRALAKQVGIGREHALAQTIHPRDSSFFTLRADEDYFRFTAAAGGTYIVEILNVATSLGRTVLYAYDSSGTQVASDTYCYNGTGNTCSRIRLNVSVAGEYFIQVRPYSSTASGTYTIRVLPRYDQGLTQDAASEPNDVGALATQISVGRERALTRTIHPRDSSFFTLRADQDYYRFTAAAGRTYVVEIFQVSTSLGRTVLYAYDSSGAQIASDTYCYEGTANACSRVQFDVSIAGEYFLRVAPYSSTVSGSYSIRVLPRYDQGLTWDPNAEVNDERSLAYPMSPGIAQGHTIGVRNNSYFTLRPDEDFFRFPAQANRTYVVEVKDLATSLGKTVLYVYDQSGMQIASDTYCYGANGNICSRVQFNVSIAGNYFIRVLPYSSTASGTYTVCGYDSVVGGCLANVLKNPSFESAGSDLKPSLWTSDSRFTRSNAVTPRLGTYVGRLHATDNSSFTIRQTISNWPLVTPYSFSGWVNIPSTSDTFTFKLQVRWRNAAGGTISTSTIKTYTTATSGWNQATATSLVAPAGTNNAQLEMVTSSLNATIYVDNFVIKATR